MESDPFDITVDYHSWRNQVFSELQMVNTVVIQGIEINSSIFQQFDRVSTEFVISNTKLIHILLKLNRFPQKPTKIKFKFLPQIEFQVELPCINRTRHVSIIVGESDSHLDQFENIHIALDQSVSILNLAVLVLLVETRELRIHRDVSVGLK